MDTVIFSLALNYRILIVGESSGYEYKLLCIFSTYRLWCLKGKLFISPHMIALLNDSTRDESILFMQTFPLEYQAGERGVLKAQCSSDCSPIWVTANVMLSSPNCHMTGRMRTLCVVEVNPKDRWPNGHEKESWMNGWDCEVGGHSKIHPGAWINQIVV